MNGNGQTVHRSRDLSMGELFKQLSSDSGHLVQQEIRLAKLELRESASRLASAGAKVGVAMMFALPGAMALVAAAVIGLGIAIKNYWLSSLIIGVVLVAIAAVLIARAKAAVNAGLTPQETVRTARETAEWAGDESVRVKNRLTA